ncbi:MAG: response regulator transcription factor [Anaerolineae bacterium]
MMGEQARILVADDEKHIGFFLREILSQAGHQVVLVHDGRTAVERLNDDAPFDLMLLDIRMPGKDGIEVMRVARDIAPSTVIILLTGHATVESAIAAVREGAHDYLLKPASTEELLSSVADGLARRRQLLRQQELVADIQESLRQIRGTMQEPTPAQPTHEPVDVIHAGPLTIDLAAHVANLHGDALHLTPIEFDLLTCLAREAGTVLRPEEIVQAVWGHDSELWEARSTLNPHLTHLRQKLQPNPDDHQFIVNVRGVGYKFVSPTR